MRTIELASRFNLAMRAHAALLIAVSLSLIPAGCQSASDASRAGTLSPNELPPKEAAKACLATARRLDGSGYEVEAIDEYERARQLDPSLTTIARRLAVLHDRQGHDSQAIADYLAALRETPRDAELLNDFGFFYASRNDGVEAEKWLQQSLTVDPKSARTWVNLGVALAEERKYLESYYAFSRVLPHAQALSNVGVIQAQQGDYVLAEQSLALAISADSRLPQAKAALQWTRKRLLTVTPQR